MKTFECKKLRPCSGLIMAKTKTNKVEFPTKPSNKVLVNYIDYKKFYTDSGSRDPVTGISQTRN